MHILVLLRWIRSIQLPPQQSVARWVIHLYKRLRYFFSYDRGDSATLPPDNLSQILLPGDIEHGQQPEGSGSYEEARVCLSRLPTVSGPRSEYPLPPIPEDLESLRRSDARSQLNASLRKPASMATLPHPVTGQGHSFSNTIYPWSTSRPPSRASMRSRTSVFTTGSRQVLFPQRTLRATHLSFGVTTSVSLAYPVDTPARRPDSGTIAVGTNDDARSSTESPTIFTVFCTNRYDRYVKMSVLLIYLEWRSRRLIETCY